MAMDTNWSRWIFASITTHFDGIITISTFVEGMDRQTKDLSEFAEIRIDGPRTNELSADYWRLYIEVNILIQTIMNDRDLHRHWKNIGDVNMAFLNCISVYKKADRDGNNGDGSRLGCFQLVTDRYNRENIVTSNFGQIDKSVKLQQATVEAHYEMFLSV